MGERESSNVPEQQFTGSARWLGALAIGFALLFAVVGGMAIWTLFAKSQAVDFLSYWAAGHLVTLDRAADAYDIVLHRFVELSVSPIRGLLPFPYPPPFLLVVTPFGLLSYPLAFALWLVLGYSIFAAVAWSAAKARARFFALGHPAVLANALIGQNGFLTCALMWSGTAKLRRKPWLGGAILGLLVIKPQLGVLIPIALIAAREWRGFAGAAISSSAALVVAGLLFGFGIYQAFLDILPVYVGGMSASKWPWNEMATVFAFLRFFGVQQGIALIIHGLVAVVAVIVTWRAWARDLPDREATLAAATMLVTPYLLTYDSLMVAIPLVALVTGRRHPWLIPAIWLCCFLPVMTYFDFYPGPNTVPFASILCLWALNARKPTLA